MVPARKRLLADTFVILGLATAMHLDWHLARPMTHHLSLGWAYHWLLAIPVFGLTGWYVVRTRARPPWAATLLLVGLASILAAGIEPAWEYWIGGAPLEWAFGRARLGTFAAFLGTGVIVQAGVLFLAGSGGD